jgi:7-cyano-7-deazaguanine synthase
MKHSFNSSLKGFGLTKKAVVLVSGGLDSAVVSAVAKSSGFDVYALTFWYGQRHGIELESAKRVCSSLGISNQLVLSVDLSAFGGSALTDQVIDVPKGTFPGREGVIPLTYVPARNTIFLSLALSWAEALGARDIFIGVSSVDYSGYPDCRPEFIRAFQFAANLGTRSADTGESFEIHAPLVDLTKKETILKGIALGVDFGVTWTCYDPQENGSPCLSCESCQLRARGFDEAGVADPLLER